MTVYEKLLKVQSDLKAPKNLWNKFGGYNYRNAEGILEAVKPVCAKYNALIYLTDEIINVGMVTERGEAFDRTCPRNYVKATAHFIDIESGDKIVVTANAREEEAKKGMDGAQITGASSSYARKYALNGLLNIDDVKDSDDTNDFGKAKAEDKKEEVKQENKRGELEDELVCEVCGEEITDKVAKYSKSKFGKTLCFNCQKKGNKVTEVEV